MNRVQALLQEQFAVAPGAPFAGAAARLRVGSDVATGSCGYAVRYRSRQWDELPRDAWRPMTPDTVFDIASLTKLFTAIATVRLAADGQLALTDPVRRFLPAFAGDDRATVRHLLSHTAGLAANHSLWPHPGDRTAHLDRLARLAAAGPLGEFCYSDIGFILAGWIAERVSGMPLARLIEDGVCGPLGMATTRFTPAAWDERIAATEVKVNPPRGLVRGIVHDEMAHTLGGLAGNAGLFSTLDDLERFGRAVIGALTGRDETLLPRRWAEQLLHPWVPRDGQHAFDQCLGFRRGDPGVSPSPATFGHTGFTGTSLILDPAADLVGVVLTNRVHPTREGTSAAELRVAFGRLAAGLPG